MKCRAFEYYSREWRIAVLQAKGIKYESTSSVRKHNRAVDRYRRIARIIGEMYPERIEQFAENMKDENEEIRISAAVCLVELMPHTEDHLSKAKSIVSEHISYYLSIPETDISWNWWLSQPWADESNCVDYHSSDQ